MRTVTIVGAGNVGTTLGLVLHKRGHGIAEICSRTAASAERARAVIGAGKVVEMGALSPADLLMITTGDNALYDIADALFETAAVREGTIAFHCSGATSSSVLARLRDKGAHVASVHPIKTFTSPEKDCETFPGTWCGIEGDAEACAVLEPLMRSLGAETFRINPDGKALYHAGLVFACNYLFPVIEAGLKCYEAAGVERAAAMKAIAPVLHATVDNALRLGPGKALTGPIARGDDKVVGSQLRALGEFDPDLRTLYEILGSHATALAVEKGVAPHDKIALIREMLHHPKYVRAA